MAFVRQTFTVCIDGFRDVDETVKEVLLTELVQAISTHVFKEKGVLPVGISIAPEAGSILLTFEDKWDAEYVARRQNQIEREWEYGRRD